MDTYGHSGAVGGNDGHFGHRRVSRRQGETAQRDVLTAVHDKARHLAVRDKARTLSVEGDVAKSFQPKGDVLRRDGILSLGRRVRRIIDARGGAGAVKMVVGVFQTNDYRFAAVLASLVDG